MKPYSRASRAELLLFALRPAVPAALVALFASGLGAAVHLGLDATALPSLPGAPRARLIYLLDEPLPTVKIARRLQVTPSAVSQHLWVLYATALLTWAQDGRQVLYRGSLGDQLAG